MNAFFNMGGYAAFIWGSYFLTFVIMLGLLIHAIRFWWEQERQLENLKTLAAKKPASQSNKQGAS